MPIVINELMPSNSKTVADDHGGYADWIELYNPTEKDVDLGGYYVSDKLDDPRRFRLPERLSLTAKGYLLLWADGNTGQGDSHLPFKLHKEGEAVVIAGPDGSFLDSVEFVDAQQDYAYARFPNEVGNFAWCSSATPGDANPEQCPSSSTGQNAGSSPPSDAGSD